MKICSCTVVNDDIVKRISGCDGFFLQFIFKLCKNWTKLKQNIFVLVIQLIQQLQINVSMSLQSVLEVTCLTHYYESTSIDSRNNNKLAGMIVPLFG